MNADDEKAQEGRDSAVSAVDRPNPAKLEKKKKKAQEAWITFTGRVVAQIIGAAATVFLGLYFVNLNREDRRTAAAETSAPGTATSARTAGDWSVAVLALQNYSGDPRQDYFADGMTEALVANLAQQNRLRVISRTSSMRYKGQNLPLPQIARELGAAWIVEGSVARSGDRVRVTAQLIDAAKDEHVWAQSYEEAANDVLKLQSRVAGAIAEQVTGKVTAAVSSPRRAASTAVDPAAYDLYLRGRYAWGDRTPESNAQAIRYFNAAIEKQPDLALAHAGLADAYQFESPMADGATTVKARAAIERALALDDQLAEAHAALGGLLHHRDVDVIGAEREFRRALELNNGYATAHQWFAIMLAELQRDREALQHARQAVAIDPLSGVMHQSLGLVHYAAGRYDEAITSCRRALELGPKLTRPRDFIPRALLAKGDARAAVAFFREQAPASPEEQVTMAAALMAVGDSTRAEALVREVSARKPLPAGALARWYAIRGDRPKALEMVQRVLDDHGSALQIAVDPVFDRLRTDPRFNPQSESPPAIPSR